MPYGIFPLAIVYAMWQYLFQVSKTELDAMTTLLAKYLAKPTQANALRVAAYHRAHPFAEIMLDYLERGLLAQAIAADSQ